MATSFQIPDSMLYSTPSKTLDGELNFVEYLGLDICCIVCKT